MATPERTGEAVSPPEGEPLAAGAFIPDAAVIERLANSFFQDLTGGASIEFSRDSGIAPSALVGAPARERHPGAAPRRPARGPPRRRSVFVCTARWALPPSSASPFAFVQSRAVAPAVSQTAIAAPRVDPRQAVERRVPLRGDINPDSSLSTLRSLEPAALALSPFSAPVDFSVALSALRVLTRPDVTALSLGAGDPSGRSPREAGHVIPGDAVPPPDSPARARAIPTAAALLNADPLQSPQRVDLRQSLDAVDSSQAGAAGVSTLAIRRPD